MYRYEIGMFKNY